MPDLSENFKAVYDKLHTLAEQHFRRQSSASTLQATALVHEVYLRFAELDMAAINDTEHLMAVAATAMRQILVDRARRRKADKRGGGWDRITLNDSILSPQGAVCDVLAVDDMITRLNELSPRQARVVEMRVFTAMTVPEVAHALGVSVATVEKDWRKARAWMRLELSRASTE